MRILHISETIKGGVGNYLFDLAQAQASDARVCAVGLVLPGNFRDLVPDGLKPHAICTTNYGRQPANLFTMARQMRRAVREFQPDVLFVHSTFAGVLARLPMLILGKPCKVVFIPHSWSFQMAAGSQAQKRSLKSRLYALVERLLLTRTDHVLCVAQAEVSDAEAAGLPIDKCKAILTGLHDIEAPLDALCQRKLTQQPAGPTRVAFVGRFGAQKASDVLAEVAQQVPGEIAQFHIMGDGEPGDGDMKQLQSLDHCHCYGWVSRDEAQHQIAMADVLFMPSRWEGLPLTTLEAMRASTALLTSDIDVLKDIVEQHQCGEHAHTSQRFVRLLTDTPKTQWHEMGARARKAFHTHYRFDDMLAHINQMIGLAPAPATTTPDQGKG